MAILANILFFALVIICVVLAYITIFTTTDGEKFNVERKQHINYIVITDDYDRGFSDKDEALDFAALNAGTVIDVESNETIADFTTIDFNPFTKGELTNDTK